MNNENLRSMQQAIFDAGKINAHHVKLLHLPCVSFNEKANKIHMFHSAVDDADEQGSKLWLSTDEYAAIRQEHKAILDRIKQRSFQESEIDSARGLVEHYFSSREEVLRCSISAVLTEQQQQRAKREYIPEQIASKCCMETSNCVRLALIRGKRDAEEVSRNEKQQPSTDSPSSTVAPSLCISTAQRKAPNRRYKQLTFAL